MQVTMMSPLRFDLLQSCMWPVGHDWFLHSYATADELLRIPRVIDVSATSSQKFVEQGFLHHRNAYDVVKNFVITRR
jgi:hypothetical protein